MSDTVTLPPVANPMLSEEDTTVPCLSDAERRLVDRALILEEKSKSEGSEKLECFNCHQPIRHGELSCPKCGIMLATGGKTELIEVTEFPTSKGVPVGKAFMDEQKPINFEINGTCLTLPIADTLVIGRLSKVPGDAQPDVHLNAFGADACGVSRKHIKLTRRGDLTYITDMGSSNGTFLNGRPITHQRERVLRSGDVLQLGHLKIRVSF